jgi:hypothetical protein
VLVPALVFQRMPAGLEERSGNHQPAGPALWPFSGRLEELLRPGQIVIAECYPAEFYTHLGQPSVKSWKSGRKSRARRHLLLPQAGL